MPLLAKAPELLGNPAHSLVIILTTLAQKATYFHCIPSSFCWMIYINVSKIISNYFCLLSNICVTVRMFYETFFKFTVL